MTFSTRILQLAAISESSARIKQFANAKCWGAFFYIIYQFNNDDELRSCSPEILIIVTSQQKKKVIFITFYCLDTNKPSIFNCFLKLTKCHFACEGHYLPVIFLLFYKSIKFNWSIFYYFLNYHGSFFRCNIK